MSALGPRRGLHCGTHGCLQATLPVSCTVTILQVLVIYVAAQTIRVDATGCRIALLKFVFGEAKFSNHIIIVCNH